MNIHSNVSLVAVLALSATLLGCSTVATAPMGRYISAAAVDSKALLQDPPADNSAVVRAELDCILAFQASLTPEDLQRIKAEGFFSLRLFSAVLGPSFKPETLPVTEALLASVSADAQAVINRAKARWNRPRPWVLDSRIQPCVGKPTNASYPSDIRAGNELGQVIAAKIMHTTAFKADLAAARAEVAKAAP
jgi:acid phosphatase (class A)